MFRKSFCLIFPLFPLEVVKDHAYGNQGKIPGPQP